MGERELPAALLGLFAGCVWDLHAAKSAGFNALFFMLLCFGVSAVMERYIRSTFVTHMLFALPAPFLYGLLYWLCFILIKGVDGGTNTLFTFYLLCPVHSGGCPHSLVPAAAPAPAAEPQGPAITGIL